MKNKLKQAPKAENMEQNQSLFKQLQNLKATITSTPKAKKSSDYKLFKVEDDKFKTIDNNRATIKSTKINKEGMIEERKNEIEICDYKLTCRNCKDMDEETYIKYEREFNKLNIKNKMKPKG